MYDMFEGGFMVGRDGISSPWCESAPNAHFLLYSEREQWACLMAFSGRMGERMLARREISLEVQVQLLRSRHQTVRHECCAGSQRSATEQVTCGSESSTQRRELRWMRDGIMYHDIVG